MVPGVGEIWRAHSGAVRYVRDVDLERDMVAFSRMPQATASWTYVWLRSWYEWIEANDAVRTRRADGAPNADWRYIADERCS